MKRDFAFHIEKDGSIAAKGIGVKDLVSAASIMMEQEGMAWPVTVDFIPGIPEITKRGERIKNQRRFRFYGIRTAKSVPAAGVVHVAAKILERCGARLWIEGEGFRISLLSSKVVPGTRDDDPKLFLLLKEDTPAKFVCEADGVSFRYGPLLESLGKKAWLECLFWQEATKEAEARTIDRKKENPAISSARRKPRKKVADCFDLEKETVAEVVKWIKENPTKKKMKGE